MADIDILIVGGAAAGSACAEALTEAGYGGSFVVVSRDPDPPYERPFCSKDYLRGKMQRAETYLGLPEGLDLRVRTSVTKLDPQARTAKLSSGEELSFEHAVLGTGANIRRLRVEGGDLDHIHYLRTLRTSDEIREDTADAEHVVMIGGSFIACEVAASLTAEGRRCTMVMQEESPLSLWFGERAAAFFAGVLRDHGVEWVGGDALERFEGSAGRVRHVITAGGRELEADAVVIGVGVVPDVSLARSAGLDLAESGGILCSQALETSVPGIYAAGDNCDYDSVVHGRRLRVEHWEHARAQGAHVGRVIAAGEASPFTEIPYFWSDLADWATLEYVGPAATWDDEVVRGSVEDGEFTIFYRDSGKVVAALTVGRSDDLDEARELIASGGDL